MSGTISVLSRLPFWKTAGISFFLGLLLATTFAPLHLVFFLPVCFSGVLILLGAAKTKKQAFFIGWWFGWGQYIGGLYWIGIAFTIDADAHAALIPLPTLGLPAFLALFTGLATLATYASKAPGLYRVFMFAGFWTLFEYCRGLIFTGFPWNLAGYSWGDILPILQWVSYVGIYGLTLLTILISSLPAILAETSYSPRVKKAVILGNCIALALIVGTGYLRIPAGSLPNKPDSYVRIVQPNIAQADKWKTGQRFDHVKKIVGLSTASTAQPPMHLIWPETAIPFFLTTDEKLKRYLQRFIPANGTLITGAPRKNTKTKQYWNSVQVLNPDGEISALYDKRHLVPYGEYMPMRGILTATGISSLIPALDQMSDFSTPDEFSPKTIDIPGLGAARVLICYEVAFPWEVSAAVPFDWILNVTNDAWFGNTSGPYQHFVITKTRAIEQGMSVIRAANTGISAVIDGYGRVQKHLPLNEAGIIDSMIPQAIEGGTLYKRSGESIPIFLIVFALAIGLFGRWHKMS